MKVARKATARNAKTKRMLRDSLKAFSKALSGGKPAEIAKAEKRVMSAIDVAAKKAIIHKNKASRKKSRLAKQAKTSGVKPSSEPSRISAKADTGKAARRSTAEKPAKVAPSKKPAAKKTRK